MAYLSTRVRAANPEDAPEVTALWNSVISETTITFTTDAKSNDVIRARLAEQSIGNRAFVAERAGKFAGFVLSFPFRAGAGYARVGEFSVYVTPDAQGAGVARALVDRLSGALKSDGLTQLVAGISGENTNAIEFHQRLGFAHVGRLPAVGFKFGRSLDLVFMQKTL